MSDRSHQEAIDDLHATIGTMLSRTPFLSRRSSGVTSMAMEGRVTRLEVEFEHVRRDLDEIKADQKGMRTDLTEIRIALAKLPTTDKLWVMVGTMSGVALAFVAIVVAIVTIFAKP